MRLEYAQLASAKASYTPFTNKDLVRLFLPTLDGHRVLNDGDPQGFETHQAAIGAARRFRSMCMRKTDGDIKVKGTKEQADA